jgi:hypothetical protein
MKKLVLVLLAGCVSRAPHNVASAYWSDPCRPHQVYVDGHTYWETGVAYGEAPADTIIPDEDPEVGPMTAPTPSGVVDPE